MSLERVNMELKNKKEVHKSICLKRKHTPIVCLTTGDVFTSASEAERKLGVWAQSILNCCDGKTTQASGKKWAYV